MKPGRSRHGYLQCSVVALAFALMVVAGVAAAAAEPIVGIAFEGNDKTRESVMLREIPIKVGDEFNADLVELSRQQIQNLGLFRSVQAQVEPQPDGVRIVFKVVEKWFWTGYPRLSANSDGQNSIGVEGKVNNLWGLNHTFRILGRSRDSRDEDRGRDVSIRGSYYAPYLLGDRDSLRISASTNLTPFEEPYPYDETVNEVEALAFRTFGLPLQHSQGWSAGLGLVWRQQQVSDNTVARDLGISYGLVTEAGYRNVRDLLYSDDGTTFSVRYEIANHAVFSDFSYSTFRLNLERAFLFGERAHQQVSYGLSLGMGNNPLERRALFFLGGSEGLKGFERKAFEGNSFYLGYMEIMRPFWSDSLRGTVGLEVGNASWDASDLLESPNVSLNFGLRLRPRRLIKFELELGFAIPLTDADPRFYGGKVDRP